MSDDLKRGAYSAWERARQHIYASWTRETDPANLQPQVSRLNRQIAALLRKHPPSGLEQARLDRCLDAIESPCSRREALELRATFERTDLDESSKGRALVELVETLGLQPFQAPAPLPPIAIDEIHLVCWMAIEQA